MKRTQPRHRSPRRAAEERLYLKRSRQWLEGKACERCDGPAVLVHHKRGRTGSDLNDTAFFAALCHSCHLAVHANPSQSYIDGWLVSRNATEEVA